MVIKSQILASFWDEVKLSSDFDMVYDHISFNIGPLIYVWFWTIIPQECSFFPLMKLF